MRHDVLAFPQRTQSISAAMIHHAHLRNQPLRICRQGTPPTQRQPTHANGPHQQRPRVTRKSISQRHIHDTPAKKLADSAKPILTAQQRVLKHIVPVCRLLLSLTHGADGGVLRGADRTLGLAVDGVETALVEGVLAQEVDRGQVEVGAAGRTALGVEDGWVGG